MTADALPRFARVRHPSELVVVAVLVGLGVILAVDTLRSTSDIVQRGPVGPATLPLAVSALLVVCAVGIAIDILRGRHGIPDEGEAGERSDWRTLAGLASAVVLCAIAVEPLGWVLAGGAMFYLCVFSLGSRHVARDLVVSAVLALGSFYLFYDGLGVALPAGVLEGIL